MKCFHTSSNLGRKRARLFVNGFGRFYTCFLIYELIPSRYLYFKVFSNIQHAHSRGLPAFGVIWCHRHWVRDTASTRGCSAIWDVKSGSQHRVPSWLPSLCTWMYGLNQRCQHSQTGEWSNPQKQTGFPLGKVTGRPKLHRSGTSDGSERHCCCPQVLQSLYQISVGCKWAGALAFPLGFWSGALLPSLGTCKLPISSDNPCSCP